MRELRIGHQVGNDASEQVRQGLVVLCDPGERRVPALRLADDRHAQAVERANGELIARLGAEAAANPFLHFLLGILGEREQQQFRRAPVALPEQPAGLGHDGRCLAAARSGHDQVAILVDNDRAALLVRQRILLNVVEEAPGPDQFVGHKDFVGPTPVCFCVA